MLEVVDNMSDNSEYIDMYLVEARENLEKLNSLLVDLEKEDDKIPIINEVFRVAHTFKGMSSTMGFNSVAKLTHAMETTLDTLRSGESKVTADLMDILFDCMDSLEEMTDEIEESGSNDFDVENIIIQLENYKTRTEDKDEKKLSSTNEDNNLDEKSKNHDSKIEEEYKTLLEDIHNDQSVWRVDVRKECNMPSIRIFQLLNSLESHKIDIVNSRPNKEDLETLEAGDSFLLKLRCDKNTNEETVLNSIGEMDIKKVTKDGKEKEIKNNRQKTESKNKDAKNKKVTSPKRKNKKTTHVRVDISILDNLMNLIGELVINKGRLQTIAERIKDNELYDTLDSINRISSDVRESILTARLIPLSFHFNRFPRMVRDLSRKMDKEIDLKIEGGEIELDRTVIDQIGDPLVHLLRNSIDHGIESQDIRKEKGKPVKGTVSLVAIREKNSVVISVKDDGKGLNPDILKQKALEKGLIDKVNAEKMTDKEAFMIIFKPGFSTAEKVTDTSGRGVGMDAVSSTIESIGGTIDVISEIDSGTEIRMTLPISMAIVQSLLTEIDNTGYAIPLSSIKEILHLKDFKISSILKEKVFTVRGKTIPLVKLSSLLSYKLYHKTNYEDSSIVVLESSGKEVGLLVNKLIGQQEIVIKPFGQSLQGLPGFSGATIMGDGSVFLILDTHSLLLNITQ